MERSRRGASLWDFLRRRSRGAEEAGNVPLPRAYAAAELADGVIANGGSERATYLIDQQISYARTHGVHQAFNAQTPYINTIPVEQQVPIPCDQEI